ncbi:MAG: hypothetical protein WDW36_003822 [Sanguina aurantia]
MSKARAPHTGAALLRKLKLAQESGSTASFLLEDGAALLNKADKLRGFVKQQRQRTDSSSAKSSWMTMTMQMQAEGNALEGEIAALINKAIAAGVPGETQELLDLQTEMQAAAEGMIELQLELQDRMGQLASAVHCLRMYSPEQSQPERAALQDELQPARQGLELAMAQLASLAVPRTQSAPWATEAGTRQAGGATRQPRQNWMRSSAVLPDAVMSAAVAPLLCAGITTYSPLKHWKVGKGSKVGVIGLGGLGHMALKIAHAFGATVVQFTTSPSKREDALRLGADEVVLSNDAAQMKAHAGSFDFILDTVSAPHDLNVYLRMLKRDGTMTLVGLPDTPPTIAAALQDPTKQRASASRGGLRPPPHDSLSQRFVVDPVIVLVRETLREQTHQELGVLRAQRAAGVEAGQAGVLEQQARRAVASAEAAARQLDEGVAKKQLIADYRNEMGVRRNQELMVAAHTAHVAAAAAHAQAATNKERVEWRMSEYVGKLGQQKEVQVAQAAEGAAREARLDRLRALVAPHAVVDPARLLQATLASAAAPEGHAGIAFQPLNGYSNEQVYRDQRAKLSEALTSLGLQNTQYGRHVIAAAKTAVATRPDNMTFEQRAHLGGAYAGGL